MDITGVFYDLVHVFESIILWMQTHGFFFLGTFYSFFNIEVAALVLAFILTHLPIWGDTKFVESEFYDDWEDY